MKIRKMNKENVFYYRDKILNDKDIEPKRKKVYKILMTIIPELALLFDSIELNRSLKKKKNTFEDNNKNRFVQL